MGDAGKAYYIHVAAHSSEEVISHLEHIWYVDEFMNKYQTRYIIFKCKGCNQQIIGFLSYVNSCKCSLDIDLTTCFVYNICG